MSNWQCPECDSFNPETVDSCLTCGAHRRGNIDAVDGTPVARQVQCPNCQGSNPPTRKLCQWCGYELPASEFPVDSPQKTGWGPGEFDSGGSDPVGSDPVGSSAMRPQPVSTKPPASSSRQNRPPPAEAAAFMPVSTEETELAASQRKEHSDAARPCHFCGNMMEPDEWILVAGPKLVCRYCYHEEIRGNGENGGAIDEGGSQGQGGQGSGSGDRPGLGRVDSSAPQGQGGGIKKSDAPPMNWKAGSAYLALGALCLAGGAAVTVLWSFTWGFTPLAAGGVLAVLGFVKAAPKRE